MTDRAHTIRDIANALCISRQAAQKRADREGWKCSEAKVRGGKRREYALSGLPEDVRIKIAARQCLASNDADGEAPGSSVATTKKVSIVTDQQRIVAQARVRLVRLVERSLADATYRSLSAACSGLADLLAHDVAPDLREIACTANDHHKHGQRVSARTLLRWCGEFRNFGEAGLVPGRRQKDMAIPAWAPAFLKFYQRPTKPSVEDAYRQFAGSISGDAPSIHQVRRFLNKLSVEAREKGRMGPREIIKKLPFKRRKFEELLPNDIWTADGHTFDAEVQHPFYVGRAFRPEITTYLDIRARRIVGWSVELAESAVAVLDAMRYGVRENGIPAVLYVDNGKGYDNEAVRGVLDQLGVTFTTSLPYRSQARGAIERIHRIYVDLAKRLPTYIGADMDPEAGTKIHKLTRAELKAQGQSRALITWERFVEEIERTVAEYNDRKHSSLNGLSPDAIWNSFEADGWAPETLDPEMLDLTLRPRTIRTLQRGEVRLWNRRYFAHELGAFDAGTQVSVGYDVRDDSRVWVHDLEGRLLAVAERDGNATLYMPGSFIADGRAKREQAQVKRLADKIETRTGQKVTHIQLEHQPGRTLDHLLRPELNAQPEPLPREDAEAIQASQAQVIELMREQETVRETDDRRIHAQWLRVQARIEAGEFVSDEERNGLAIYRRSSQHRSMTEFFEEFGLSEADFPPREAKGRLGCHRA